MSEVTGIRFEWDEAKNLANWRKHGISFEQASKAFGDPLYISVIERIEAGEERWQTLGLLDGILLLTLIHTVFEESEAGRTVEVVRMISARYAIPEERRRYENENG